MGLTSNQDIQDRPKTKQEWSIRRLLSFVNIVVPLSAFTKDSNRFELFFGFMLLITGIGELINHEFEWLWFVVMILISAGAFHLRLLKFNSDLKDKKNARRKMPSM